METEIMKDMLTFDRVDLRGLENSVRSERVDLRIRWWVIIVAILLCGGQATLSRMIVSRARPIHLIMTQVSVIAFAFLAFLTIALNPLMRLTRLIKPFNRAESIALFAAMFVSAGIAATGLADVIVPLMTMPFNPQFNLPQAGWQDTVIPHLNENLFITDTDAIIQFREGFGTYSGIMGRIPWGLWLRPISLWLILIASLYLMYYGLSLLFYDSWARREKVVFPLARLPEYMVSDVGAEPGSYSSTVRQGLFWVGFIFVFALVSYNAATTGGLLRGLEPVPMGIPQRTIVAMFRGAFLEGIAGRLRFIIVFTAISIGYLLPNKITFSIWAYWLIGLFMTLVAFWIGFKGVAVVFASDAAWENNFLTSLGGGGLFAFGSAYVIKLVVERWQDAWGRGLSRGQRIRLAIVGFGPGGALALLSMIVATVWLWWAGVPVHWGILFLIIMTLIIIAHVRLVAEAGIYNFQYHTGPFHLAHLFGGSNVVPGRVIAPMMLIHSVSSRANDALAPEVMNSFKMQDESRSSAKMFHTVIIVSILATIIIALMSTLIVTYRLGGNQSPNYRFTEGPRRLINGTQRFASEGSAGISPNLVFYIIGAGWVAVSMVARRRIFWWLHPIGFVMLVSWRTMVLWFPFFLGWLFKRVAIKYGGRHSFEKYRPFFIGLLMGELVSIFFWSIIAYAFNIEGIRGIDITRFGV